MCSPMRDAIFQPTFFALKLLQRACQMNLSAVTMPCYVSFSLERNPQFTRLPFRDFFQTTIQVKVAHEGLNVEYVGDVVLQVLFKCLARGR